MTFDTKYKNISLDILAKPCDTLTMTKAEALKEFKTTMIPGIIAMCGKDKVMIRTEWNDYVDSIQKDGWITEAQAARWTNPF